MCILIIIDRGFTQMNLKVYLLAALVCFCLPGNFAVDDYESDYSDSRDKVSPEHKGVEDVLKNMYLQPRINPFFEEYVPSIPNKT